MIDCLICGKLGGVSKDDWSGWYNCSGCQIDSDQLSNGVLYPFERRSTLCDMYTPVVDLDVKLFKPNDEVSFTTIRNTSKSATVLHIDLKGKRMILQDTKTKNIRILIDNEVIANSYNDLVSVNKVEFAGWWNRRISNIHKKEM